MNAQVKQKKNGQINIILKDYQTSNPLAKSSLKRNPFSFIDEQLSSLVGLDAIKQSLKQIYAIQKVNEQRQSFKLKPSTQVYHMLFTGNPGTGKTTVARKLAKIFYDMNILSKGHFIEVDRSELVGEYIGQTAQKTRSVIKKALGGVLFIDEAYSLARGGEKDFGKEAIDTIVKLMEDYSKDFILILAGYPREMEYFLSLNPGLESRFPFQFHFPDYSVDELVQIAKGFLKENEYMITKKAEIILKSHLLEQKNKNIQHFSNGRYVRNVIEKAIRYHAVRLMYEVEEPNIKQLSEISVEDFQFL